MTETYTPENLFAGSVVPKPALPVTILTGQNLVRGTALGKITKAVGTPVAGENNTGDGVLGTVLLGQAAKVGNYELICIIAAEDGGTFKLLDPDGERLDDVEVGEAYVGPIGFTLADGESDFAEGDTFTIPVVAGSGAYKTVNSASVDGSQEIEAILAEAVDASQGNKESAAYIGGEFNEDAVVFGGADTHDTHRAAAKAKGIIFRPAVPA